MKVWYRTTTTQAGHTPCAWVKKRFCLGQQLIFLIFPTGFQELERFLKLNAFLIIAFCRPTALSDQVRRLVFDVFALRFCPIELLLAQPGFLSFPGVVAHVSRVCLLMCPLLVLCARYLPSLPPPLRLPPTLPPTLPSSFCVRYLRRQVSSSTLDFLNRCVASYVHSGS